MKSSKLRDDTDIQANTLSHSHNKVANKEEQWDNLIRRHDLTVEFRTAIDHLAHFNCHPQAHSAVDSGRTLALCSIRSGVALGGDRRWIISFIHQMPVDIRSMTNSTMSQLLCVLFILQTVHGLPTGSTTTEQLRQWLMANSNSIPAGAKEAISMAAALEGNDLASTILKIFGFGPEKQFTPIEATFQPPTTPMTPRIGAKISERDVCPFGAEPLLLSGEYTYCKPSLIGECPVGFLCDQSFVLGRSICCQDLRNQPAVITVGLPNTASSSLSPTTGWSTISAATETTEQPRWTPFSIVSTRKAPWYIKERTPWDSIYTRTTPEATTTTLSSTESSTTTSTEPITSTTTSSTTTTTEATTLSTAQETTSTVAVTTEEATKMTSAGPLNPWARIWTTSSTPRNMVNVSVLQSGNLRPLSDGQMESVGAISLINDNGRLLLVDTGAASDTERLLQSMLK